MRTNVDVLSMSATPIPRTLEMAVTGIREMSTIATPPEERHPVLTFVGALRREAGHRGDPRELLREGQVFFVHNRVQSIEKAAARLRELVPEARIATAHGQMSEHRLEQVVVDFWEKRFDVLVCTTIVETGLDISNANTLIVERADMLGPVAAAPVARGGSGAAGSGPTPTSSTRRRSRSPRPPTTGSPRSPATPTSAPAWHRDEGPGDPRRRQPARRRAVRAHRGRRLRPLRAPGRGGGRGIQGRGVRHRRR
jgi:hypothetical protein